MRLPRVKYHFKFLIKSEWSGSLLKLNKFAPVLNQLAIEDSSKLDETINYFYENQNWPNAEPLTLFGSLSLLVWRRQAPYSLFFLRPATLDSLLKIWSDENDRGVVKTNSFCLDLLAQRNGLLVDTRRLSLLANLKDLYWSPEFGYRYNLTNVCTMYKQVLGTLHTYRRRKEMLGRRINFRRKLKGKTLEEY